MNLSVNHAPYAVGVDIARRMKLNVYDRAASTMAGQHDRLANLLENEPRFGVGANFKQRKDHEVMDEDWSVSSITRQLRDKAWTQLGTSGSGNHFVEFGAFTVTDDALGILPGECVALLSHSGSRDTGAKVCDFYSKRVIPGSMASPGYVVRGKGQPESLNSASHAAGRVMSRTKALQSFTWSATKKLLAERDVELLSAGLDEVPGVYKDIDTVMEEGDENEVFSIHCKDQPFKIPFFDEDAPREEDFRGGRVLTYRSTDTIHRPASS